MRRPPRELFNNSKHKCLCFDDLVAGDGVQSNQFLIVDNDEYAIIDPGGDLTYTPLSMALAQHIPVQNLTYVLASHQDPDIIAAIDKWLLHTRCKVVCSRLWERFLPHLTASSLKMFQGINTFERIIGVPDRGMELKLGQSRLKCLPAHFLHSVGNLHFYDPVSKILFSGDMGASIVDDAEPVKDFQAHIPHMEGFHRRYMASNKACRLWANMARKLDIEMIVPQHGRSFVGREMIALFFNWISELECGLDLMTQADYVIP